MGDGGAVQICGRSRLSSAYRRMAGGTCRSRLPHSWPLDGIKHGLRRLHSSSLGCRSRRGPLDQPAAPASRRKSVVAGGRARSSLDFAPHVAFFRKYLLPPRTTALPPDNFQETPKPVVAHRTSPTNIGLYLLSTVCARDFGWLGALDTVGAPGSHARDHEPDGIVSRAFLQLV